LPVSVTKRADKLNFQPSVGGLATGLASFCESQQSQWLGWPGIATNKISQQDKQQITNKLKEENYVPVFLSAKDIQNFYEGFCNKTIWPLFHYFPLYTRYEAHYWQTYKQVNEAFCGAVTDVAEPDDYIWVHDSQWMLLPQTIRD
jgi:trehalose 6-phosphate synthase/phosphatase